MKVLTSWVHAACFSGSQSSRNPFKQVQALRRWGSVQKAMPYCQPMFFNKVISYYNSKHGSCFYAYESICIEHKDWWLCDKWYCRVASEMTKLHWVTDVSVVREGLVGFPHPCVIEFLFCQQEHPWDDEFRKMSNFLHARGKPSHCRCAEVKFPYP